MIRGLYDASELQGSTRYIWTLYVLRRLIAMYGFLGDEDVSFAQDIGSFLRTREEEFFTSWTVLDPVDFISADEDGMSAAAYGLRMRLCDIPREIPSESIEVRSCRTHDSDRR